MPIRAAPGLVQHALHDQEVTGEAQPPQGSHRLEVPGDFWAGDRRL